MPRRFLVALCIVVFYALLATRPEADAQVQNGSVFNSEGPAPNTGPAFAIQSGDNPPNGSTAGAIQAIAADPSRQGTIYVGSPNGGIWKTTNGGTSWTPLIDQKASLSIASLAFDPTDQTHQTLIAGTGATSNGSFASRSLLTTEPFGSLQNGLLYSRVVGGVLLNNGRFAAPRLRGLFYSNNAGATWRQLITPIVNPGRQAAINFALAIDPTNSNLVYVMGDNVAGGGGQDEPANNLTESALAIFRVNAATDVGSLISDENGETGNTANGSFVHADGRVLAFEPNGTLLTGTDGGLYARPNPQSSAGVWEGLQGNLSVMGLYALAYDSNSHRLVVAAQDNAMAYQSAPGNPRFNVIGGGGDGLNAGVNDVTLGSDSAIYISSQELFVRRLIVDQTGTIISPSLGFGLPVSAGIPVSFNVPVAGTSFGSPFVLNNIDKTRIAVAGSAVYVTQDTLTGANGPGATSIVLPLTELGATTTTFSTIDYGTRNNPNALVAGGVTAIGAGALFLSTSAAASSLTELPTYSGFAPTSVKFDLRSDQRFFVADSINLFGSVNRGASFQTLTGNLPANFIRPTSLAFLDSNGVDALFVGGLNNADNASNPLVVADSNASGNLSGWRRFGAGLPNTTIFALS
jgi:hypothetical protein